VGALILLPRAALVLLALACVTAGAVLGALTAWGCSP
jgi:hypothetical protein